jgi:hypothetical protein
MILKIFFGILGLVYATGSVFTKEPSNARHLIVMSHLYIILMWIVE